MSPLQRVHDGDVDLGPVEGAVAGVQSPGLAECVEALGQGLLGRVPNLDLAHELVRPRRQAEIEGEAEDRVDVVEEVQAAEHLLFDLLGRAEYVGVVLLEATDPGEAGQGARELVTVEHPEVGHAERQLAPGSATVDNGLDSFSDARGGMRFSLG